MPTYLYTCDHCALDVERRMSFAAYEAEGGAVVCEHCGGALRRRFGAPDVAWRGRWHDRVASAGEEAVYRSELRASDP